MIEGLYLYLVIAGIGVLAIMIAAFGIAHERRAAERREDERLTLAFQRARSWPSLR